MGGDEGVHETWSLTKQTSVPIECAPSTSASLGVLNVRLPGRTETLPFSLPSKHDCVEENVKHLTTLICAEHGLDAWKHVVRHEVHSPSPATSSACRASRRGCIRS